MTVAVQADTTRVIQTLYGVVRLASSRAVELQTIWAVGAGDPASAHHVLL